jgi:hypothetical protein
VDRTRLNFAVRRVARRTLGFAVVVGGVRYRIWGVALLEENDLFFLRGGP